MSLKFDQIDGTGPDLWNSDDCARRAVGLQAGAAGSAVQWFMFFLSDRRFYVSIVDLTSTSAALPWRDHKAPILELKHTGVFSIQPL